MDWELQGSDPQHGGQHPGGCCRLQIKISDVFFFKKMLSGSSHYPVKLIGQKDVVIEFSVFGTHGNIPCLNCKKDSGRIFSTNI